MNKNQKQFTTARIFVKTHKRVSRAKITHNFETFESALDTFILLGIKAYRKQVTPHNN